MNRWLHCILLWCAGADSLLEENEALKRLLEQSEKLITYTRQERDAWRQRYYTLLRENAHK